MLIIVGDLRDAVKVRDEAINGLIKAASKDLYGYELYGELTHSDGWGMVSLVINGSSPQSLIIHKSLRPIYSDPLFPIISLGGLSNVNGLLIEMIHARAASEGTPRNITSTHPVHSNVANGGELYMIHNGSFRRDELAKLLNLSDDYRLSYNDTYVANLALASRLSYGRSDLVTEDDLRWLLRYVKSGANLGILLVNYGDTGITRAQLVVGSYYVDPNDGKSIARRNYYKLYWCRVGNASVYSSSTIIDYYAPQGLTNCSPLSNGEYHSYILDIPGGGFTFNRWVIEGG